MEIEELGIKQHLENFAPFKDLQEDLLNEAVNSIVQSYYRGGEPIYIQGDEIKELYYIRSGAVELFWRNGELYDRLEEGYIFGQMALLRKGKVRFAATALEDSLIYTIPAYIFDKLCEEDDNFADFMEAGSSTSPIASQNNANSADEKLIMPIKSILHRQALLLPLNTTAQETAIAMSEKSASAIIVMQKGQICGILTDRDMRSRLVAEGLSPLTPIKELMTKNPLSVQLNSNIADAIYIMLKDHIHHLPVLDHRTPVGILHLSDIIRHMTQSSMYFVETLFRQNSIEELMSLKEDFNKTFIRLVSEENTAYHIGHYISSIGRAYIQRLIQLAEQELGKPPIPYAFVILGSIARDEQILHSDQDHGIILDNSYDENLHGKYFRDLAHFVTEGLARCGYAYCIGDIMATNPKWCQPLNVWENYFTAWLEKPTPEALLQSSIFFDMQLAYGEQNFVDILQNLLVEKAPAAKLFLAALARNTLTRTPPLGMFRTFIVEKDGKQNDVINLKRRGTAILVDIVRVHCLAAGITKINTFDRIEVLEQMQYLPEGMANKLNYAMEFLSSLRIKQQRDSLLNDEEPDNVVLAELIYDDESRGMRDAFSAISNAQKFLQFKYPWPTKLQGFKNE